MNPKIRYSSFSRLLILRAGIPSFSSLFVCMSFNTSTFSLHTHNTYINITLINMVSATSAVASQAGCAALFLSEINDRMN